MDRSEAYDVAKRRIEERERKRNFLYLWLALLAALTFFSVLGGGATCGVTVPLAGLIGLIAVAQGIQLYYESPHRVQSAKLLEREMSWLYGNDWMHTTGSEEFAVAQDRLRKRRIGRWMFLIHLLLFIPVNRYILIIASAGAKYNEPSVSALFAVPALWLFFLLRHAWQAFPAAGILARRERKAGEALELELEALHFDKQKRGEKAKRQPRLVLSDDGELLEVPETTDPAPAKSKREIG